MGHIALDAPCIIVPTFYDNVLKIYAMMGTSINCPEHFGSSNKWPSQKQEATIGHVNCGVVYVKSINEITVPSTIYPLFVAFFTCTWNYCNVFTLQYPFIN